MNPTLAPETDYWWEQNDRPFDPAVLPALIDASAAGASGEAAMPLALLWAKAIAYCQAQHLAALAAAGSEAGVAPDRDHFGWCEEMAGHLHVTGRTTSTRLAQADQLTTRLPKVFQRLAEGAISQAQALSIAEQTMSVADGQAVEAIDAKLAERAPRQGHAATVKMLRRAVLQHDPHGAEQRHRDAVEQRDVWLRDRENGMVNLSAYLSAPDGQKLYQVLDTHARQLLPGDERTLAQRRADALLELLTTGSKAVVATEIRVTVPLDAIAGATERPAELEGYGAITAGVARELARDPQATWRRLVTDPVTKEVLSIGRKRYRPPTAMARLVRAHTPTCTFPSCTIPAARCELDHVAPWSQGGETSTANLAPACKRHHTLRHTGRWTATREADGQVTWTSPGGRSYVQDPTERTA